MFEPELSAAAAEDRAPRTHRLKLRPEFFAAVVAGTKTFEYRNADRGFAVGDYLVLREYNNGAYTGRDEKRLVTYILEIRHKDMRKMVCMAMVRTYAKCE